MSLNPQALVKQRVALHPIGVKAKESLKNNLPLTPVLKWAGGKRWLLPKLQQLTSGLQYKRLVEPFSGGLSVALGLQPHKALLNDINPHVINLYQQIQLGLKIEQPLLNDEAYYYHVREQFNQAILENNYLTKQCAVWFYYLNRTGFNGLCRFNQKGLYNVPFGRYKTINYQQDFLQYQAQLKQWQFRCTDFEQLDIQKTDFIYADPPYDVEFTSYSKEGFTWVDQERLAHWLAKHKGPVVASNQATPRIIALYQCLGFEIEIIQAPRLISCKGKQRQPVAEMLAFKI